MANPLRKTMVYLGLAEDVDEPTVADERPVAAAAAPAPAAERPAATAAPQAGRAPVTPLRRSSAPKNVGHDLNEILTVHPRQYQDARVIAEHFRDGVPVIINVSQMSEPEARRLIDFASGLAEGLLGKIERVTGKVFLLSPSHIAVTGDQGAPDADTELQASFAG